ncbi:MAG TPA: hypothetical protein VLT33_47770, partial [Labilithrix sp.]|nr:hypothetical protein [Labilithrix sp.]
MKYVLCTFLIALAACGGGGDAKTPDARRDAAGAKEPHESIGDAVAAQGGLASLGGAGNREDGSTGVEVALGGPLHAEDVDKKTPVKLDGVLREWPARYAATQSLSGKTDGLGLAVAVQTDETKLYVGVEITDPALARTSR